uniref:Tyrosine-protein kinase ephrin type A/B receptor-like domain-containing protein n=2 Tax=Clastoptera arizonana TaxID=38151 RepID=A0A1B6E6W5_9HEMI
MIVVHAVIHYKAALKCDESILEMFELYLPQQIEMILCDMGDGKSGCDINIHNPVCLNGLLGENNQESGYIGNNGFSGYFHRVKHQTVEESMEMSLNFEVLLHKTSDLLASIKNTTFCNPLCHQKIFLKMLQLLREHFPETLLIKVTSSLGSSFEPIVKSIAVKYVTGCLGGFELLNGFCTPCKKDHFSQNGDTSCSPCKKGTYQNQVGARSCIECKYGWIPACNEFIDEYSDQSTVIVVIIVGAVICLGTIFLYIYSIKQSGKEVFIKMICPCLSGKGKKANRAKLAKSARFERKRSVNIDEESEPLLSDYEN